MDTASIIRDVVSCARVDRRAAGYGDDSLTPLGIVGPHVYDVTLTDECTRPAMSIGPLKRGVGLVCAIDVPGGNVAYGSGVTVRGAIVAALRGVPGFSPVGDEIRAALRADDPFARVDMEREGQPATQMGVL